MRPIWLGIGVLVAAAAIAAWRLLYPPVVPHFAILFDASHSQAFDCEVVPPLAARALAAPGAAPASRLLFIVTGDSSSAYGGTLVATVRLPVRHTATRGRWEAERREAFFADLRGRCAALPRRDESPILGAITSALAALRAAGCRPPVLCHLYVATDGQESVDPALRSALRGETPAPRPPRGVALPAVDNAGIAVSFCGFDQPTARSRVARVPSTSRVRIARLTHVWSSQFSAPELVDVEPYCQSQTE